MSSEDMDVRRLLCEGEPVATVAVARTARQRTRGLLGRDGVAGALLLVPARNVHTVRMRFAVDVALLDATLRVLRVQTLAPNRISRPTRGVRSVLEAEAGALARWGVAVGSQLALGARGSRAS